LRRADYLSKGVLSSVQIILRNVRCEAAEVLARTVEPLVMMSSFYDAFLVTRLYSVDDRMTSDDDDDEQRTINRHSLSGIRTHGLSVQDIKAHASRPHGR
jgi:hypothetical protein